MIYSNNNRHVDYSLNPHTCPSVSYRRLSLPFSNNHHIKGYMTVHFREAGELVTRKKNLSGMNNTRCFQKMTHAEKHHRKHNYHRMETAHTSNDASRSLHVATMAAFRGSCCGPPDAHQQTAALVTGNHSTAAHTEPYLHRRLQNTYGRIFDCVKPFPCCFSRAGHLNTQNAQPMAMTTITKRKFSDRYQRMVSNVGSDFDAIVFAYNTAMCYVYCVATQCMGSGNESHC